MSLSLQELSDREQIRAAISRYYWGIDRGEPDLRYSAFAPDGRLVIYGVETFGPNASSDKMTKPADMASYGPVLAFTHNMHQCDIHLRGDEAFCETNVTAHLVVEDGQGRRVLTRGLRYHDHMVRVGDDWRIKERQHRIDWMVEGPAPIGKPLGERDSFAAFMAEKLG